MIQNFNGLALRNDVGQLWENYLMVERQKVNQYSHRSVNAYFWRTYDQKEIDYIEEQGGKLYGYEFKWKKSAMKKSTEREFLDAYPGSELNVINQENFTNFLE